MGVNFKPSNRDQDYILSPSLRDLLPEDELAWFLIDVVDTLDLSAFYQGYREGGKGGSLYDPQIMLAILVYAYCLGEHYSRAIERNCKVDIGYRVVAANSNPDHSTISRFRQKHLPLIQNLFTQVLVLYWGYWVIKNHSRILGK